MMHASVSLNTPFARKVEAIAAARAAAPPPPPPKPRSASRRQPFVVLAQHSMDAVIRGYWENWIADGCKPVKRRDATIADIKRCTAQYYGLSIIDLVSSRRTHVVVRPRQVAMYLAKMMTPRSLPEIGRQFRGRDHTTVLHAARRIEALKAVDPEIAAAVDAIRAAVEGATNA